MATATRTPTLLERAMGRGLDGISPTKLLQFTELDPRVQQHLARVYATLTVALLAAAAGVACDLIWAVGGTLMTIAAFGSLLWLGFTPATPQNASKRYALLCGFSFAQGTSIGPLVGLALGVNPGLILTTVLATASIFVCFTASALMTQRRSYLFLGGWLSSAITSMLVLRLCGWLFGLGKMAFLVELYGGLLVMSGFVLLDTQLIVERASAGDFDHVRGALDLFVDAWGILVRVLIILLRNQQERSERDERRRRRRD